MDSASQCRPWRHTSRFAPFVSHKRPNVTQKTQLAEGSTLQPNPEVSVGRGRSGAEVYDCLRLVAVVSGVEAIFFARFTPRCLEIGWKPPITAPPLGAAVSKANPGPIGTINGLTHFLWGNVHRKGGNKTKWESKGFIKLLKLSGFHCLRRR